MPFGPLAGIDLDKVESAIGERVFIQPRMEFERDTSMEWSKWLPGPGK
jgi:hypothetical protein